MPCATGYGRKTPRDASYGTAIAPVCFTDKRSVLSGHVSGLLVSGKTVFTAEEAERAVGVGRGAFLDAAERLQRRKALLGRRQGFHVVGPPPHASWGAPPPAWYIDALMRREGRPYYVGLLNAAELHGASHQAVMEFQVVSNKRLPKIRAGRNLIVFCLRKEMEAVTAGIEDRKTDTGTTKISSAALTALDLPRYPQASGGIDHVATVLSDLGGSIDPEQLAAFSPLVERPVVQRLGHLLARKFHRFTPSAPAKAGGGRGDGQATACAASVGLVRSVSAAGNR